MSQTMHRLSDIACFCLVAGAEPVIFAAVAKTPTMCKFICRKCEWWSDEFVPDAGFIPEPAWEEMEHHARWHHFDEQLTTGRTLICE